MDREGEVYDTICTPALRISKMELGFRLAAFQTIKMKDNLNVRTINNCFAKKSRSQTLHVYLVSLKTSLKLR